VRLDVTNPEEIAAALETITHEGHGLYGLVNNPGVASAGPLIEMPQEEFDLTMIVNLFGPYRLSGAFAPLHDR
jgi:NAD(P)-dependent dehydrogenase (short-subunit alcohol dehydrogenase family)